MDNYPLPTRRRAAVDSAADAAIALRLAAGGSTSHDASDAWTHADVSGGGCVASLDAPTILQAAASAIEL